ncbi:choice-of-anchor I family protein [Cellvibrio fontiphilus]|uniref:Choice-of-anchor I family protein n=1 Tax=Cellvibrio fontiphilus TaxID=1815559 RepID=A0ABV7FDT5_9GAMM
MKFNPLVAGLALAGLLGGCGGDGNGSSSSSASLSDSSVSVSSSLASTPASSSAPASSSSSSMAAITGVTLKHLGRYSSGQFGVSAAEIPAYDPASKRGFIVNAQAGAVDVLDLTDPTNPIKLGSLDATSIAAGAVVNSVAVRDGLVALAVEAATKTDPGYVALYRASNLSAIGHVAVGAQPDMLTFTPDGTRILSANEGEPSDDYSVDPEGSVSIVNITDLQNLSVQTAAFTLEANLKAMGVRIYGPNASQAQDLEPEYIAVSADSRTAWVTLQENNALAVVDIASATITSVKALGYKDHGAAGKGMDSNDEDGLINITTHAGVRGLYLPDAIHAFSVNSSTYLVTANEGDARAWGEDNAAYWEGDASKGFVEEFRVKHLTHTGGFDRRAGDDLPPQLRALGAGALLNPEVFGYCGAVAGNPGNCRADEVLGRLNITWTMGYRTHENGAPVKFNSSGVEDAAGDRLMYDALYSYGGRSISIWNSQGEQVWDSGDAIEQFIASEDCKLGAARNIPCANYFNSGHDEGSALDSRSDAKGPEPEGLTIGQLHGKTYVFVGLERMGGILVYDITNPAAPVRVDYLNTREDWTSEDPGTVLANAGDLGPEGLTFIRAEDSPNGKALLMVGNEVSGTTSIYEVEARFAQ